MTPCPVDAPAERVPLAVADVRGDVVSDADGLGAVSTGLTVRAALVPVCSEDATCVSPGLAASASEMVPTWCVRRDSRAVPRWVRKADRTRRGVGWLDGFSAVGAAAKAGVSDAAATRLLVEWEIAAGRLAGPSVSPMTATASTATAVKASRARRGATRAGRPGSRSPRDTRAGDAGAPGSGPSSLAVPHGAAVCGGPWTAPCRRAESSVQNASAVGGSPLSPSGSGGRGAIGTSSSRGPSHSRGSRTTLWSARTPPLPSSVCRSPVSTGFAEPFLTVGGDSVSLSG